ncbi:MAG: thioredoxin domain-containing protein [Oscillospiraceae bacterium]|nr:thioredoxin domain-containing protein [Oscillospiraceae bacterium]
MSILVKPKNFEAEVLRAETPVLVDFFGEHCLPCLLLRPILLALGEELAGRLKICMFNTDRERRESDEDYEEKFKTIAEYGVMHLPTLLLFIDGELKRRFIGLQSGEELLAAFAEEGLALEAHVIDKVEKEDEGKV